MTFQMWGRPLEPAHLKKQSDLLGLQEFREDIRAISSLLFGQRSNEACRRLACVDR